MGFLRFLAGLILGALVGAALALLLTPQSGEEFQRFLRQRAEEIVEEGRRAAAERRAELEAQFAQAKRPPQKSA
ncbi:MAG: YtxH domain-containing protein [Anaerolineae bacterium]